MIAPTRTDTASYATTPTAPTSNGTAPAVWRPIALPLGLGLLVLAGIFNAEISAAVGTWIQSTAYNHCFLVIPIAGFLLRERRSDLAGLTVRPQPWVALLGVPLAVIWLVAERLGIMEGRQLVALSFVELLFLGLLGWRFWWAVAGPLLYLYFLVPFGEFLTPRLQDFTTAFVGLGLRVLNIPAYIDGYIIEIPQGTFLVAEACAGLRFLVASVAFGCLYALMMYRSPVRRAVFITASIIVPVVANGFRGLGIVYLGYLLNSAQAAAADHILYGWLFFSIVILMLIALGLPFRQDDPRVFPPRRRAPPTPRAGAAPLRSGFAAALVLVVVAAVSPLLSAALAMAATRPAGPAAGIDLGPGCVAVAGAPAEPDAAAQVTTQRVVCGGITLDVVRQSFSPRSTAAPVMQARRHLVRRTDTDQLTQSWFAAPGDPSGAWQIMRTSDPDYVIGVAIWIDGRPVRPGMAMRLRMARDSLFGSAHAPTVLTLTPAVSWPDLTPDARRRAMGSVAAVLQAHPDLDDRIGTTSAMR